MPGWGWYQCDTCNTLRKIDDIKMNLTKGRVYCAKCRRRTDHVISKSADTWKDWAIFGASFVGVLVFMLVLFGFV